MTSDKEVGPTGPESPMSQMVSFGFQFMGDSARPALKTYLVLFLVLEWCVRARIIARNLLVTKAGCYTSRIQLPILGVISLPAKNGQTWKSN
jgi:hypothetical protein